MLQPHFFFILVMFNQFNLIINFTQFVFLIVFFYLCNHGIYGVSTLWVLTYSIKIPETFFTTNKFTLVYY